MKSPTHGTGKATYISEERSYVENVLCNESPGSMLKTKLKAV